VSESLPRRIQRHLARAYGLEAEPHVDDFVRLHAGESAREALLVRHRGDDLDLALVLPERAARGEGFDGLCQVIEGVSHFVLVAERARRELPATELELELQAEVDKFVFFAALSMPRAAAARGPRPGRGDRLRRRLYERVVFLHPPGTERGERYRLANGLAARFAHRLESDFLARGRGPELTRALRRFHGAGQAEKIALATG
jgi:hypothetical protein